MKGVYFGSIHSFRDLNLILEPFTPTPAEPQTNFLQVPGRDGVLDLTEANGEVKFNSRNFSIPFTIVPGDDLTFDERVSKVSSLLNGVQCKITFERDPDFYWIGRCAVEKYAQNKNIGQVVIKATVNPYKLKQNATETTIALSGAEQSVTLANSRMAVVPTITCTDRTVITFGGETFTLEAGTHKLPGIRLVEGDNALKLSGTGTVTITYQEGAL